LEQATGNPQAAAEARQHSITRFLAYRRAGGQSMDPGAQFCALVAQARSQSKVYELKQILKQYLGEDIEPWAKVMIQKLQVILQGDRDPALADDPDLEYKDAVELILLLETLNSQ